MAVVPDHELCGAPLGPNPVPVVTRAAYSNALQHVDSRNRRHRSDPRRSVDRDRLHQRRRSRSRRMRVYDRHLQQEGDPSSGRASHAPHRQAPVEVVAHNMIRWTAIAGRVRVENKLVVARTLRTRMLAIPDRLVNRSGRPTLGMPTNWPWAATSTTALDALRSLEPEPVERRPACPEIADRLFIR